MFSYFCPCIFHANVLLFHIQRFVKEVLREYDEIWITKSHILMQLIDACLCFIWYTIRHPSPCPLGAVENVDSTSEERQKKTKCCRKKLNSIWCACVCVGGGLLELYGMGSTPSILFLTCLRWSRPVGYVREQESERTIQSYHYQIFESIRVYANILY